MCFQNSAEPQVLQNPRLALAEAANQVRLSAPSTFVQRYVETHHMPLLIRAVEQVMGPVEQVVFER